MVRVLEDVEDGLLQGIRSSSPHGGGVNESSSEGSSRHRPRTTARPAALGESRSAEAEPTAEAGGGARLEEASHWRVGSREQHRAGLAVALSSSNSKGFGNRGHTRQGNFSCRVLNVEARVQVLSSCRIDAGSIELRKKQPLGSD